MPVSVIVIKSLTINPAYKFAMIGKDGVDWFLQVLDGPEVRAKNVILMGSNVFDNTYYAVDSCFDGGNNTGWIFLGAPSVTTEAVSNTSTVDCLAHGNITAAEAEISRRGFCYIEGTGIPTVDNNIVYEDGSFTTGEYSLSLTGLTQGTKYSIRAYIVMAGDTYYGSTVTAYTIPDTPDNLVATASDGQITVTWDAVAHADSYTLYYGTIAGLTTSSSRFAGSISPFIHLSLVPGRTYYYRISATTNGVESALSPEVSDVVTGEVTLIDFSPQNWIGTEDYVKLLTSQYQMAENFKAWLRYNIEMGKDIMDVANSMNDQFDVDFALGDQLDIIGQIVGISRTLPFQPSDGSSPILDDETYIKLIKATIARNHWDGQLISIEEKWVSIFPDTQIIVIDNQDMTLTVSVSGDISELLQDMISHDLIFPRPQAVAINYTWVVTAKKKFCYDMSNLEYGGYNEAAWVAGS